MLRHCGPLHMRQWYADFVTELNALTHRDEQAILVAAAARVLFVPAFRVAAVSQAGVPAVLLLTASLGSTNGFVCACAMIRAPATVPSAAAGLAGNLMVLSLVLGLCLGAGASFLWLLLPA